MPEFVISAFALPAAIAECLKGNIKADLVAIFEAIHYGLGRAEHPYLNTFDHMVLNPYTPGADPDATFRASYPAGYTVDIISGAHGQFFESPNVETLAEAIGRRMEAVQCLACDQ